MLQSSASPRRHSNSASSTRNLVSTSHGFHGASSPIGSVETPTSAEDGDSGTDIAENRPHRPVASDAGGSRRSSLSQSETSRISTYAGLFNATPNRRVDSATRTREPGTSSRSTSLANHFDNLQLELGGHGNVDRRPPSVSEATEEDRTTDTGSVEDNDDENRHFYNIRNETLPDDPIYNTRLQAVLLEVRNQFTEIQDLMSSCPLARTEGSNFYEIYQQIESLSNFAHSTSRTVGFIGDSGVGKSALINSLLDEEDLARSSGDGTACTSVATEFRHVDPNHPHPFTVVVDFMDDEEVEELLRELLGSFRLGYTDSFGEDRSVQEQQDIQAQATRAWETLRSLFRSRSELTREFLSDQSENAELSILSQLQQWATEGFVHRPGGGNAIQFTYIEPNTSRCRARLDELTTDPDNENIPAIWPFVKLLRVYLGSPILRTGLVLTDLPGFRDLNFARVSATERYLRHSCDEVFVVTTISRCLSDESVTDIIRRADSNQPLRIICTRSEDVRAEEMIRNSPRDTARRIEWFRSQLRRIESRINNTMGQRRRATGVERSRLAVEETQLRDDHGTMEFRHDEFLIELRNGQITSSLRRRYADIDRSFCISNRLYSEHRQDEPTRAEAYIRLSGVPELRTYCQSVPADARFRATAAFLEQQAPAFLGSLNQWALAGSDEITAERAADLRRILLDAREVLIQGLTSRESDFITLQRRIDEEFAARIRTTIQNQQAWQSGAIEASQEWRGWAHQSYSAFCRKNGTHKTATIEYRCWNDEILNEARRDLWRNWYSVATWLQTQQESIQGRTRDMFQTASSILEANIHLAPRALENLLSTMEFSASHIAYESRNVFGQLVENTMVIRNDALQGHDSSYIAGIMRPAFRSCMQQAGAGSDLRRKNIIRDHLSSPNLFAELCRTFKVEHHEMVNGICQSFREYIRSELANFNRDLGEVVAEEGELTEAGQYSFLARQLREKVGRARSLLDRARTVVEEIRPAVN